MNDIAGMVIGMLGSGEMDQLSSQLGVDSASTQKAVGAAVPMLLSALGKNAASPQGAAALLGALRRDHDGSVLDNVSTALSSGSLGQDGAGILGHVLGSKQKKVAAGIGQASGLTGASSGQLLALLAPLVLGSLGKTQREDGLDATGLASLLSGQRAQANAGLGGLAGLLDMDGDGDITDDVVKLGSKLLGGFFGR
ncbi:MAG: DUF937 domain-containing protein [Caldilineaceae bacterium]|nr:DUF937 domain-containing protein [Caldilineaceae bacterium]HRJ45287.1 DUF937 domain-containing protein [Caldilineaceae bacterium]